MAVVVAHAQMTTTKSGLQYNDVRVGTGEVAAKGKKVEVQYTGWLYVEGKKGTKFDSSVDRKKPLQFKLGSQEVIDGWDEGVEGMKEGGKRELIVPPNLGFGRPDIAGIVPANSTLFFEIELTKVLK